MKVAIYIVCCVTLCLLINTRFTQHYNHEEYMSAIDSLNARLDKRDYLDSLYHDHLSECSFISKENIYVDKRGYVKSYYYNGVKK